MKPHIAQKAVVKFDRADGDRDGELLGYYFVNDDGMKVFKDAVTGEEEIRGPNESSVPPIEDPKVNNGRVTSKFKGVFVYSSYLVVGIFESDDGERGFCIESPGECEDEHCSYSACSRFAVVRLAPERKD